MKVPEDNDSVCNVCKDMVQQARDQLESNQTQQDLKAVFEGSCKLIHLKPIVKECVSIVDQFIPELVETLASQMNPSVVCSVAGLCNSAHIDKLLEKYEQPTSKVADMRSHSLEKDEFEPDECTKCYTVAAHMEHKLRSTPRDQMLKQLLNVCADFSTFSDACSAIIVSYFDTIHDHLRGNFNPQNICHLSGQCNARFHKHDESDVSPKVEIRPLSSVGMVDVSDDLPCKLCEQLVGHLKDLLVANTTEAEFHQVLDGLCKQTKSFADECTSIVDEYYPQIYEYLTKGLNSNAICQMTSLCPAPGRSVQSEPIWPLLPHNVNVARLLQNSNDNVNTKKFEELSASEKQLPIERMMPFPFAQAPVEDSKSCALCGYVLHQIQESLTNPVTEDKVKDVVESVCKRFPDAINRECQEFIETYGDAIVAILVQEIDPSTVCPMLHLCPSPSFMALWRSIPGKYVVEEKTRKPSCPMCLLAISEVYNVIKDNKTEAHIKDALEKACSHLLPSLSSECQDLVDGYSKELIEMLLADLTPQEVCVYIKLCDPPSRSEVKEMFVTDKNGEILTNEIPDIVSPNANIWTENKNKVTSESLRTNIAAFSFNNGHLGERQKRSIHARATPSCTTCKLIIRAVDKKVGSDKTKSNIENAMVSACNHVKAVSHECQQLADKHGDYIINAFVTHARSNTICSALNLCESADEDAMTGNELESKEQQRERISISGLFKLCPHLIDYIAHRVGADKSKPHIEHLMHEGCDHLPHALSGRCGNFITKHGDQIIHAVAEGSEDAVCAAIEERSSLSVVPATQEDEEFRGIQEDSARGARSVVGCLACEALVDLLEHEIGTDRSRDRIKNALNGACGRIGRFSGDCESLVQNHADELIDAISNGGHAKDVCKFAKACRRSARNADLQGNELESKEQQRERISISGLFKLCPHLIDYIAHRVGADKSKPHIEHLMHEGCDHLPHALSGRCGNFITKHGDQIIHAVAEGSEDAVCAAIEERSSLSVVPATQEDEEFRGIQEDSARGARSVVGCLACEALVDLLEHEIGTDRSRDRIKNALNGACGRIGRFSGDCESLVQNHADELIDAISNGGHAKDVCKFAKACRRSARNADLQGNELESKEQQRERISISGLFKLCPHLIDYIAHRVGADKSKPHIEHLMHEGCDHLPHALSGRCGNFITKHGDQIIHAVAEGSEDAVCAAIEERSSLSVVPATQEDEEFRGIQEDSARGARSVVGCLACEALVDLLEHEIGTDRSRDRIKNALNGACGRIGRFSGDCESLVQNHADELIDAISNGGHAKDVCKFAKACRRSARNADLQGNELESKEQQRERISISGLFKLCPHLIDYIAHRVGADKSKPHIEHLMHEGCDHLPHALSGRCGNFITKHGDQIIHAVAEGSEDAVCAAIEERSSLSVVPATQEDEEFRGIQEDSARGARSVVGCLACEALVDLLEHEIGTDRSRDRIKNALNGACGRIGRFSGDCESLVQNHADELIDAISNGGHAKDVCKFAKACRRSARNADLQGNELESKEQQRERISISGLFKLCPHLIDYIAHRVGADKSKPHIEHLMHEGCDHLPHALSGRCGNFITKHGDQIIHAVAEGSEDAVCAAIEERSSLSVVPATQEDEEFRGIQEDSARGARSVVGCLACEALVDLLEHEIGTDRSRDRIKNALNGACGRIGRFSGDCESLVQNHADELIDAISNGGHAKDVCKFAKACRRSARNADLQGNELESKEQQRERISISGLFKLCPHLIDYIAHRVGADKSKPHIEHLMHEGCDHLPHALSGRCGNFITKHGDQIIHAVAEGSEDAVCAAIEERSSLSVVPATQEDEEFRGIQEDSARGARSVVGCLACEALVDLLEHEIGTDRSRDRIKNALNGACGRIGRFSGDCESLVQNHADELIDAISNGGHAKDVCKFAKACRRSARNADLQGNELESKEQQRERISISGLFKLCPHLIDYIAHRVGADKSKPHIEHLMHEGCDHLPHALSGRCDNFITKHGDQIIHAVAEGSEDAVCAAIEERSSLSVVPATQEDEEFRGIQEDSARGARSVVGCLACEALVDLLEHEIGTDRSRDRIKNALNGACGRIGRFSGDCESLVQNHADELIDAISNGGHAKDVCKFAKACRRSARNADLQGNELESKEQQRERISISGLFKLCPHLIDYIAHRVGADKSKPHIEHLMHEGCDHLPHALSGRCGNFITKHGDQIIHAVAEGSEDAVCAAIEERSSLSVVPATQEDEEFRGIQEDSARGARSVVGCLACEALVDLLEHEIGTDRSRDRIKNALNGACGRIGRFSGDCESLVQNHADDLIDAISNGGHAKDVCKFAKACRRSARNADLQGNELESKEQQRERISISGLFKLCPHLIDYIAHRVGADKSKPHIEHLMHEGCDHLPHALSGRCGNFITKHGDQIIHAVAEGSEDAVCAAIEERSSLSVVPATQEDEEFRGIQEDSARGARSVVGCLACEALVDLLEHEIGTDRSRDRIKNALNGACGRIGRFSGDCESLVQNHADELIDAISNGGHAKDVCKFAKACRRSARNADLQGNELESKEQQRERISISGLFKLCPHLIDYIAHRVGADKSKPHIEHLMHEGCDHLPHALSGRCGNFITKHGDQIIHAVAEGSEDAVCAAIEERSSLSVVPATQEDEEFRGIQEDSARGARSVVGCLACEALVDLLEHEIGTDRSRDRIKNALNGACGRIGRFSGDCESLVQNHADELIDAISNGGHAKDVCKFAKACRRSARNADLQGNELESKEQQRERISISGLFKLCPHLIDYIAHRVGADKSKPHIEHLMHEGCDHLPHALSGRCDNFITKHGDQIIHAVAEGSEDAVCAAIEERSSLSVVPATQEDEEFRGIQEDSARGARSVVGCLACEALVDLLEHEIGTDRSRDRIKNALNGACGRIGRFSGDCESLVQNHADDLIDAISNGGHAKDVCKFAKACRRSARNADLQGNELESKEQQRERISISGLFKLCPHLIDYIAHRVGADKSKPHIEHLMHEGCDHLPHALSGRCGNFITKHGDQIIHAVAEGSEDAVCAAIEERSSLSVVPATQEDEEFRGIQEDSARGARSVVGCLACEALVDLLEHEIGTDRSRDRIKNALNGACGRIGRFSGDCESLVQNHADELIDAISNGGHAKDVCKFAKACRRSARNADLQGNELESKEQQRERISISGLFKLCPHLIDYIAHRVGADKSKPHIEHLMHEGCDHLPHALSGRCGNFITKHGDQIIHAVAEGSEDAVCAAIEERSSLSVVPATQEDEEFRGIQEDSARGARSVVGCLACEALVDLLEHEIGTDRSRDRIKNALNGACGRIGRFSGDCESLVQNHADELIDAISNGGHAKDVCKFAKACRRSARNADLQGNELVSKELQRERLILGGLFDLCPPLIDYIARRVGADKSKPHIEHLMHEGCDHLPQVVSGRCDIFINKHGDQIISAVAEGSEYAVCAAIEEGIVLAVAPKRSNRQSLRQNAVLGKDKCTWGPAYWCSSDEHARECGAVQYCRKQSLRQSPALGKDKCTWGPAYWCSSDEHARECGTVEYCQKHSLRQSPALGKDKCTWGPAYWCSSDEHARECGTVEYCRRQSLRQSPVLGKDKCTWGPSYWCSSDEHARECGTVEYCRRQSLRQSPVLGKDKCTWGPSYWCSSDEHARECGTVEYCRKQSLRQSTALGKDKCTWGPSYWCSSDEHARNCGTVEYCKNEALGKNKCTWGPSYWCSSDENAQQCGTVEYCQKQELGRDKCTWGPSYWCASDENARQCGVVGYCKQ
ncbi:prosaposin isoform X2 [Nomia melanderi]|uniref:prosaposin isoform X2 n=1 Tax=Nomia melanderi TaxID=2448451 RepID=UPI003FCDCB25